MIKTTLKINGMMCPMCEAHICDVIRKAVPGAKKVSPHSGHLSSRPAATFSEGCR